jgi:hypothetical protein
MTATSTDDLLHRLRDGTVDASDGAILDQVKASDWVAELRARFPITFQERRIRDKWELGLARSVRPELAARPVPKSTLFSYLVVPVYINCVMLSIEGESVTGVSRVRRLAVRAVSKPTPGLALTTGRGFKLDKTPDGWAVKPMGRRTVRLGENVLNARGWRFDHLSPFMPTV